MKAGKGKKNLLCSRCVAGSNGSGTGRYGVAKLEDQFAGETLEGEWFADLVAGDPYGAVADINFGKANTSKSTGELNSGMKKGLCRSEEFDLVMA